MVAPWVDLHVGAFRHVAVGAKGAGGTCRMMRVRRGVETAAGVEARESLWLYFGVALGADGVTFCFEGRLVLPVTVEAQDAGSRHLALLERAVFEHLVQDLAVGKVEVRAEQARREMIEESLAWPVAVEKLRPSGMTT
jgi:hypothetical protein